MGVTRRSLTITHDGQLAGCFPDPLPLDLLSSIFPALPSVLGQGQTLYPQLLWPHHIVQARLELMVFLLLPQECCDPKH